MPNHVTSRIIVTGNADDMIEFKALLIKKTAEDGRLEFDFNGIIPMSASIKGVESSSAAEMGFEILTGHAPQERISGALSIALGLPPKPSLLDRYRAEDPSIQTLDDLKNWAAVHHPEWLEKGAAMKRAFDETGYYSWYDWSIANWGTKWNAYSFHLASDALTRIEFTMDTAWSFPKPVFEALAGRFPALTFECGCYDEGGSFSGRGYFNGPADFEAHQANDEDYTWVYGQPPERYDDEE